MIDRTMKGLFPIIAMPFDANDHVDVEDLEREVEFLIKKRVDGVGVAFASQVFKLSESERDLVTRTIVQKARNRIKVVIHAGAPSISLSKKYARRAEELGADAVMLTPPADAASYPQQLMEYFRNVANSITVPVFIQDAAPPVSPALIAQMSNEVANICYAKIESQPPPARIAEAKKLAGDTLIVFGGAGGYYLLEDYRRGAVGAMPHSNNPEVFRSAIDLYLAGQEKQAEEELRKYSEAFRLLSMSPNPYFVVNETLRLRGIFKSAQVRPPSIPVEERTAMQVRRMVEDLGLTIER